MVQVPASTMHAGGRGVVGVDVPICGAHSWERMGWWVIYMMRNMICRMLIIDDDDGRRSKYDWIPCRWRSFRRWLLIIVMITSCQEPTEIASFLRFRIGRIGLEYRKWKPRAIIAHMILLCWWLQSQVSESQVSLIERWYLWLIDISSTNYETVVFEPVEETWRRRLRFGCCRRHALLPWPLRISMNIILSQYQPDQGSYFPCPTEQCTVIR